MFIQMCKSCRLVCLVGFVRRSLAGGAAVICNLFRSKLQEEEKKEAASLLFIYVDRYSLVFFLLLAAADCVYFANWQFICVEMVVFGGAPIRG